MAYTFRTDIPKEEFDHFVENFPSTSFMQLSKWAEVKKEWDHTLAGMYEDDTLVASAMILKRRLGPFWKLYYIPRGFVIDYTDRELLSAFVSALKAYGRKDGAIDIKIDPFLCFSEENVQKVLHNKDIDAVRLFSKETDTVTQALTKEGFVHGGYKKEIGAYIQPRYTMAIPLIDSDNQPLSKEAIKKNFPKTVRQTIGSYQSKRGVHFSCSDDPDDAKILAEILSYTEQRQNIALRNENYFRTIMHAYPNAARLYFARVDLDEYISFIKEDMKNPDRAEIGAQRLKEAEALKVKYGRQPVAAATIVLLPTANKGVRTASFLYAGTNTEILPTLKITNGLMYYRLCTCQDAGATVCDLGGVEGTLDDHLTEFKSKFNPNVLELVGEYDLFLNKPAYDLFQFALKSYKNLRRTFRNILSK